MSATELLRAEGLRYDYGGGAVLCGVDVQVCEGEYLSVVGPNGSGKTTLLQLLGGLMCPAQGGVWLLGKPLGRMAARTRAQQIAIIGQNEPCSFLFTCFELVMLGGAPHRARFERPTADELARLRTVMEQTGTLQYADRPYVHLSGGERQRVRLAQALMQRPRVLLLDEAMSDLDVSARMQMNRLLRSLARQSGMAVVAIHHDLQMAYRVSDRLLVLQNGAVAAQGPPPEALDAAVLRRVFGVAGAVMEDKGLFIYDEAASIHK